MPDDHTDDARISNPGEEAEEKLPLVPEDATFVEVEFEESGRIYHFLDWERPLQEREW
jgi:hypothetical protein